jgi:trimethylamine---corrinoid protein Co-methyltransferase
MIASPPPGTLPFQTWRSELITPEQSARIHDLACRILAEIGLEVRDETYQERLRAAGFRISNDRLFIEPAQVEEIVAEQRRDFQQWREKAAAARDRTHKTDPSHGKPTENLTLGISPYAMNVQDLHSGEVVLFTTQRLVEMTRLVDSLSDQGVHGAPPGTPMDVPPDMQPIAQFRIAALYARQGATAVDSTSPRTARYLFDMAEVMGNPMNELPVYMPTPLRLGGESLQVVLGCLDRIDHVSVSSMPAAGLSGPLQPYGTLALSAAEVIGGAIAVKALTGKKVHFHPGIFPADLRTGAMVYGSPENMLFHMLMADFNCFYGFPGGYAPDNIHVLAKLPDGQSAAERAMILMTGASLGARHFMCAGILSLDEIFSAEQLLLDCEIRDWAQRAIQGVSLGEEAVEDWLGEIRAGLAQGYMKLDSTLDHYREQTWYPRWFDRGMIGQWINQDRPTLSPRLRQEALRRIAAHTYELEGDRRKEIERIYQAALREITG